MKVILLKDIKGVGKRFEEKEISNGYATNFLIPKKLAVALSGTSAGAVKALKEQEEKNKEKASAEIAENISKIAGKTFAVKMKANEKGHLFQKITTEKISSILKEQGISIGAEHILLAQPIKETGTFEVPVSVGEGKETSFTLEVEPA